jgi:SAM-dependent methyltransferase
MTSIDFGYTWPWTHGHLLIALVLSALLWLARKRLPLWAAVPAGALAAWAFAAFLVVQLVLGFNRPTPMLTVTFLAGGGKVLDVGCGSGRATIMVGLARPGTRFVALDNFSARYIRDNGEELLTRNLRAAGIADRVTILRADMRKMPLPDAEFDGVVSTYAIDHLNRAGIEQALGEVSRVLRPRGEFLLAVVHADAWMKFAFPPMLHHGGSPGFWTRSLAAAGFDLFEQGTTPGSVHYLCRKRQPPATDSP